MKYSKEKLREVVGELKVSQRIIEFEYFAKGFDVDPQRLIKDLRALEGYGELRVKLFVFLRKEDRVRKVMA